MKILTIYDGTIHSKKALEYGLRKAQESNAELLVLSVFQSSLFVDYDAGPRAEELARAEAARHQRDADILIAEAGRHGIRARVLVEEGDAVSEAVRIANEEQVGIILATARYKAIAHQASCPVRLIPGTILIPTDTSRDLLNETNGIIEEAKSTGAKVLVLGIVPVHIYSAAEKKELAQVMKETISVAKKMKRSLSEHGLEVTEIIRSGYPDEEILKAAEEYGVSLIMLPAGGKTPSELTKAAAILLDEPERVHQPIQIMQLAGA